MILYCTIDIFLLFILSIYDYCNYINLCISDYSQRYVTIILRFTQVKRTCKAYGPLNASLYYVYDDLLNYKSGQFIHYTQIGTINLSIIKVLSVLIVFTILIICILYNLMYLITFVFCNNCISLVYTRTINMAQVFLGKHSIKLIGQGFNNKLWCRLLINGQLLGL